MITLKGSLERFILPLIFGMTAFGFGWGGASSGGGLAAALLQPGTAFAAEPSEGADKTLSPYFFVKSDNPDVDQLPLKATSAEVSIAGVIADVKVVQVYKNEGKEPLEAIYVFPASTRAAVYGMKMTIGERTITAEIQKREEARQTYEKAKQEGKSASLLEQQRPNVFQMNVANILPGDEIKTELRYTETIIPTDRVYEFVYPAVVGPRYSNQPEASAPPSEKWSQNPYLHAGEAPPYTFNIGVDVASGVPIREMTCTSHQTEIQYKDAANASVKLAPSETAGGNRDFILKYRLTGDAIDSGLLLYQGKDENFFMLMAQPPKRVEAAEIPPREYIFIVDVSGSMHGFPLDISKKLLKDLIGNLKSTDSFDVLLFSGASQLMAEKSVPATPENVQRAIDLIDRQQGGGGTELLPAMKRALQLPRKEGVARSVVIATDGYVTVEEEVFDLIRKELGDANFFAFGIGSSVNRHIMEGMARVGAGEPFIITKPDEAPRKASEFRKYIQSPVLTQIKMAFDGFNAYEAEPPGVPDLLAERPVVVYGKWKGEAKGKITLKGLTGGKNYDRTIDVATVKPLEANSALKYLWARSAISRLGDYNLLKPNDERAKEITNIALKYSLLSQYTSFVAVDTLARRKGEKTTTVKQPLPMPESVSDLAVGQGGMRAGGQGRMMALSAPSAPPPTGRTTIDMAKPAKKKAFHEAQQTKEESGAKVQIEKMTSTGAVSGTEARAVIEKRLEDLTDCRLKASKTLTFNRLTLRLVIGSDGTIKSFKVVSPAKGVDVLEKCLKEAFEQWRFPASGGTADTTITVSFTFKP